VATPKSGIFYQWERGVGKLKTMRKKGITVMPKSCGGTKHFTKDRIISAKEGTPAKKKPPPRIGEGRTGDRRVLC